MIPAEGPDGQRFEFPDGTSREQMRKAIAKYYRERQDARNSAETRASGLGFIFANSGGPTRRDAGQRFVDDGFDAFMRNPGISMDFAAFTNPLSGIRPRRAPAAINNALAGRPAQYTLGDRFADAVDAGVATATMPLTAGTRATGALFNALTNGGASRLGDWERERRQAFGERSAADPFTQSDNPLLHGAAALLGTVGSSALDPTNWAGVGVARTVLGRVLANAAINGGLDFLGQEAASAADIQDGVDFVQVGTSAAVGGGLSVLGDAASAALKFAVKSRKLARIPEEAPLDAHFRNELDAADEMTVPVLSEAEARAVDAELASMGADPNVEVPLEAPKVDPTAPEVKAADTAKPDTTASAPQVEPAAPSAAATIEEALAGGKFKPEVRDALTRNRKLLGEVLDPKAADQFIRWANGEMGDFNPANSRMNMRYIDWSSVDNEPGRIVQLIDGMAEMFKPVFDEMGQGAESMRLINQKARFLGSTMADATRIHGELTGGPGLAAKLTALQNMQLAHADHLTAQTTKFYAQVKEGNLAGMAEYLTTLESATLISAYAQGGKSEVGRALRSIQEFTKRSRVVHDINESMAEFARTFNNGGEVDEKVLAQTLERILDSHRRGGPLAVVKEVKKMQKMGVVDYIGYLTTAGLLSAPFTHLRNLGGLAMFNTLQVAERYVGAGIGAVRSNLGNGGSVERVTLREANAYVMGIHGSLVDAFRAATAAFKEGRSLTDGVSSTMQGHIVPFKLTPERRARWAANPVKSVPDMAAWALFSASRTFGYRPSLAMDEFAKVLTSRMQLNALAHREAFYRSARHVGKDGERVYASTLADMQREWTAEQLQTARDFMKESGLDAEGVYDLDSSVEQMARVIRSVDLRAMAADHARLSTFQKTGDSLRKWTDALNTMRLIKYLYVPFLKTPMALLNEGLIERSPIFSAIKNRGQLGNLMKSFADQQAALARGGAEADMVLSRMVSGVALMGIAWGMWNNGDLRGRRGDLNDRLANSDGGANYTVKIGGQWVQYTPFSPFAETFGLVADIAQAFKDHDIEEGEAGALTAAVLQSFMDNVLNKTFFTGISDLVGTLESRNAATAQIRGEQFQRKLGQTVDIALPLSSLLRQVTYLTDSKVREVDTMLDAIKANVPLLSQTLAERRDWLGRSILRKEGEYGLFQIAKTYTPSADDLDQEVARLVRSLDDANIAVPGASFNGRRVERGELSRILEVRGQLYRMTGGPYDGKNMEEAMRSLIVTPEYQQAFDERRMQMIKDVQSQFTRKANAAMNDPSSPFFIGETSYRTRVEKLVIKASRDGTTDQGFADLFTGERLPPDRFEKALEDLRSRRTRGE